jgi:hypothetical protein
MGACDFMNVGCGKSAQEVFSQLRANVVFKAPLKEIMAEAEVTEVDLGTFVRTFCARLETNYAVLMDSVKEIGMDPADYPRKKKAIAR